AVESIDDRVLALLRKGHTHADFIEAVRLTREAGLTLAPTFVTFTPWTTWHGYRALLQALVDLDLVENVAPIQLALRLLVPAGWLLRELAEVRKFAGPFDPAALSHRWRHEDPTLDGLCEQLQQLIRDEERRGSSRRTIFTRIWELAYDSPLPVDFHLAA